MASQFTPIMYGTPSHRRPNVFPKVYVPNISPVFTPKYSTKKPIIPIITKAKRLFKFNVFSNAKAMISEAKMVMGVRGTK